MVISGLGTNSKVLRVLSERLLNWWVLLYGNRSSRWNRSLWNPLTKFDQIWYTFTVNQRGLQFTVYQLCSNLVAVHGEQFTVHPTWPNVPKVRSKSRYIVPLCWMIAHKGKEHWTVKYWFVKCVVWFKWSLVYGYFWFGNKFRSFECKAIGLVSVVVWEQIVLLDSKVRYWGVNLWWVRNDWRNWPNPKISVVGAVHCCCTWCPMLSVIQFAVQVHVKSPKTQCRLSCLIVCYCEM